MSQYSLNNHSKVDVTLNLEHQTIWTPRHHHGC